MDDSEKLTARLPDGRTIGYAEYGDPGGRPVFYFHGFPGSRLEARLTSGAAARNGIRVIAPDRPGIGLSGFKPGRKLLDWPGDVAELADILGVGRFSAAGISGGGPYVLACAYKLKDRLRSIAVVCGLGPASQPEDTGKMFEFGRLSFHLARRHPWAIRPFFRIAAVGLGKKTRFFLESMKKQLAPRDREAMESPGVFDTLVESYQQAVAQGPKGAVLEFRLYSNEWGFALSGIGVPCSLWHGEADTIVPVEMGRAVAAAIPGCEAHFIPEEGHISLPYFHAGEIMALLRRDYAD